MNYMFLKNLHAGLAMLSITGFVLRWTWKVLDSGLSAHRVTRIAPHVLDSLLLASGIMLAWLGGLNPWATGWLGAKLAGLVAYILLGIAAMRLHSRQGRGVAFVLALLVFAWIVTVARFKSLPGF